MYTQIGLRVVMCSSTRDKLPILSGLICRIGKHWSPLFHPPITASKGLGVLRIRQESPTTLIQTLYILSSLLFCPLESSFTTNFTNTIHLEKMSRIFMYVYTPHKNEKPV